MDTRGIVKDFTIITFGILLSAAAVYFFLVPGNLVVGSISGLALVISKMVALPISVITLMLNAVLLIVGYLLVGKEFGLKTVYTSLMLSVFLFVFEKLVPIEKSIMGDPWLDLLCFVLILGFSQTVLFRQNASSGGLDIVAKIINKYFHTELGMAITIAGVITSLTAFFVYDIKTVILGLIGTYINGLVLDHFTVGFNSKKRVCIISDKYEEVKEFIVHTLVRGVTMYPIYGGYQNEKKVELESILTRNEFIQLMDFLAETDPNAFMTAGNVSEIYGNWQIKQRTRRVKEMQKQK